MDEAARHGLCQAVQHNCHIADARHAADLTLCTYLLQMREYFRWERGLPFGASLPQDDVGHWIAAREALWDELALQDFAWLPLGPDRQAVDPFDVATVNRHLDSTGLVYAAGLTGRDQAIFVLAEAHAQGQPAVDGPSLPVMMAGREWARGLMAPPAVLDARDEPPTIILRREALARWCWERFETFSLRPRAGSPFAAVVQAYGLDQDLQRGLSCCVDDQCEALLLHEQGEHRAGQLLGPGWSSLRLALPAPRGDLAARALRDHLADLGLTLPTLLARQRNHAIHFWFATFEGWRQQLFPGLIHAYARWRDGDGGLALQAAARDGHAHFLALARRALALHADGAPVADVQALLLSPLAVCKTGTLA
jgi:hypothetical protein